MRDISPSRIWATGVLPPIRNPCSPESLCFSMFHLPFSVLVICIATIAGRGSVFRDRETVFHTLQSIDDRKFPAWWLAELPSGCLILQIGIQPHFHVFLQVAVEELVIVQMIDPIGENGQHRRIFLRC